MIIFNEVVQTKVNSTILASTMQVSLESQCKLTWNFVNEFKASEKLNIMYLKTKPECSLGTNKDAFVVYFNNPSLITDLSKNPLIENKYTIRALRYTYVPNEEYVENIGIAIGSALGLSFLLFIGLYLFQSVGMSSFWGFINMIQLISYVPGLDCDIPENLAMVLNKYITIKNAVIPFDIIPDFPYNPLELINIFKTESYNDKFEEIG